jgi:hypothetical protein
MGLDVQLCQAKNPGTSPRRRKLHEVGMVVDVGGVIFELVESVRGSGHTPNLDRIDAYGDTEFSSAEMDQLMVEMEWAAKRSGHKAAPPVLDLLELARRCAETPASFLIFQGD